MQQQHTLPLRKNIRTKLMKPPFLFHWYTFLQICYCYCYFVWFGLYKERIRPVEPRNDNLCNG